jgi:hypothetical protein
MVYEVVEYYTYRKSDEFIINYTIIVEIIEEEKIGVAIHYKIEGNQVGIVLVSMGF